MKIKKKIQENDLARKLVLAPGAADASDGLVYNVPSCQKAVDDQVLPEITAGEYRTFAEQQPGEGFWSVAPGCGDISEGRVWIVKVKR